MRATVTRQVYVNFNGSLAGTTYTLGAGEIDTSSSFRSNGAAAVSAGVGDVPGDFGLILATLAHIEERWAAGNLGPDAGDPALLADLADQLDELAEDLTDAQYEGAIARIGQLQIRLDEEGVPQ